MRKCFCIINYCCSIVPTNVCVILHKRWIWLGGIIFPCVCVTRWCNTWKEKNVFCKWRFSIWDGPQKTSVHDTVLLSNETLNSWIRHYVGYVINYLFLIIFTFSLFMQEERDLNIFHSCVKVFHSRFTLGWHHQFTKRGGAHRTSLTPPLLIEVPVPS
jgi:hypothetical protein